MYEHLTTFEQDGFRLDLWDTGRVDSWGKSELRYTLFDDTEPFGRGIVFEGEDYHPSPLHAIDSPESVAGILSFLSVLPGDTDAEYFDRYTPAQIAWRDRRAEDLALIVSDLQNPEDTDE